MNFNKLEYKGGILENALGMQAVPVGGDDSHAFHFFEGSIKNKPLLALDVWDICPQDMPGVYLQAYASNILADPVAWAVAAQRAGAQAIALQLKSIDPNGQDEGAEQASAVVARILARINTPLVVWGCDNIEKDALVLGGIAERHTGRRLVLGPIEEANYQALAPAAIIHGHTLAATSPIDVNLAKQLNILLQNQGVPLSQILIDPTTGGLGYGLEYTYSVVERLRIAALQQDDKSLALPIICNLGREIWKSKEARFSREQEAQTGGLPMRGIMMEVAAGISLLLAGANILILSHPRSLALLQRFVEEMYAVSGMEAGLSQFARRE